MVVSHRVILHHIQDSAYRCLVPHLTRFTGSNCAGPGRQRLRAERKMKQYVPPNVAIYELFYPPIEQNNLLVTHWFFLHTIRTRLRKPKGTILRYNYTIHTRNFQLFFKTIHRIKDKNSKIQSHGCNFSFPQKTTLQFLRFVVVYYEKSFLMCI